MVANMWSLAFVVMMALVACGRDSSPTGPSSPSAAQSTASFVSYNRAAHQSSGDTTVAEILADPSAFLGQQVELAVTATERFPTGELLLTDSTGSIPGDFSAAGSAPDLNVPVTVVGTVEAGIVGGFSTKIAALSWMAAPPFDCEDIFEVRARFSDPGYVFGNVVGLFLAYDGVPPGQKILSMTWDVNDASGAIEKFALGEGSPNGEGLFDLEGIVSHEYPDVQGTETKQVRAELSIVGRDGACARVRDVTVAPGSGPGWAGGGTISVSIDEGTTIPSGSTFAVRAKISNPTSASVDVHVLFQTAEKSTIVDASGEGCEAISADAVDCGISLDVGEQVTRVVRYQAPLVAAAVQIAGSAGLVARQFSPVVPYRITVQP